MVDLFEYTKLSLFGDRAAGAFSNQLNCVGADVSIRAALVLNPIHAYDTFSAQCFVTREIFVT